MLMARQARRGVAEVMGVKRVHVSIHIYNLYIVHQCGTTKPFFAVRFCSKRMPRMIIISYPPHRMRRNDLNFYVKKKKFRNPARVTLGDCRAHTYYSPCE